MQVRHNGELLDPSLLALNGELYLAPAISLPARRRDKMTWPPRRSFKRGHVKKQQRTKTLHSRYACRRVEAIHPTLPRRWLAVVSTKITKDRRDRRPRQAGGVGNNRADPRPACRNAGAALRYGTLGG